jgi:DNA-binding MarR family transcriptional regulator
MPRLDAARVAAWRELQSVVADVTRGIDEDLRTEWAVPLGWFDVLAALRRSDDRARPQDLANALRLPPSSLSRRLDRLEEEGWIARHRGVDPDDHRAVEVELTQRGRALWREMGITYRRSVQHRFAGALDDDQIAAVVDVLALVAPRDDADGDGDQEAG